MSRDDNPYVKVLADRIMNMDLARPRHDKELIERAMRAQLDGFGFAGRPIVWANNPQEARDRLSGQISVDHWDRHVLSRRFGPMELGGFTFHDFEGTNGAAARVRIWEAAVRVCEVPIRRREWDGETATAATDVRWAFSDVAIGSHAMNSPSGLISLSMFRAVEAGLLLYWITAQEAICVLQPSMSLLNGRLHSADGPALRWPDGYAVHCWRGVRVPAHVIEQPDTITVAAIRDEPNQEVRRVMVERYGPSRYLREAGAILLHEDAYGRLWQARVGDEVWRVVEVRDGTPAPDGADRIYTLDVTRAAEILGWPIETARAAVAATYGLREEEYHPEKRT